MNTREENGFIESFHGTLKREEVYTKFYSDITLCKASIKRFIQHYNVDRPHSGVARIPPVYFHKKVQRGQVKNLKLVA